MEDFRNFLGGGTFTYYPNVRAEIVQFISNPDIEDTDTEIMIALLNSKYDNFNPDTIAEREEEIVQSRRPQES